MASSSNKLYHDPGFDARRLVDTYLSNKSVEVFGDEFLKIPIETVHNSLSSGRIRGTTLIDIGMGFYIHYLYPACEIFKEITVMRFGDPSVMELKKWLYDRTGAYDWSHTAAITKELRGHQEWKDIKLKKAITQVIKCDINKENLTDPLVVPPADCLITFTLVECISKDKDDYVQNLRKILEFLKPGGHLLLLGIVNGSYYMVGEEKFHVVTYDANFVREVLVSEGFRIDQYEVLERKVKCDLLDYKALLYVEAQKEQQM